MYRFLLLVSCLGIGFTSYAQDRSDPASAKKEEASQPPKKEEPPVKPKEKEPFKEVRLDLNAQIFLGTLPFDESFLIVGDEENSKDLYSVEAFFNEYDEEQNLSEAEFNVLTFSNSLRPWYKKVDNKPFALFVPMLEPNKYYIFKFQFKRKLNEGEKANLINILKSELRREIIQKADGGSFEFSRLESSNLIDQIKSNIESSLIISQLSLTDSEVDIDQFNSQLTHGIRGIRASFENTRIEKKNLDGINELVNRAREELTRIGSSAPSQPLNNVRNFLNVQLIRATNKNLESVSSESEDFKKYLNEIDQLILELKKQKSDKKNSTGIQEVITLTIDHLQQLKLNASQYLSAIENSTRELEKQADIVAKTLSEILYENILIGGNSVGNFDTRAKYYFSADLGVLFVPGVEKASPYLGTNIYFRPVNKNRPLRWTDDDQIFRRLSLLVGISTTSLEEPNTSKDLLGNSFNLVTGAGIRVTDAMRVNSGFIWIKEKNMNPLVTKYEIAAKFFISISFDIDVRTVFNRLFSSNLLDNNITTTQN